MVRVRIQDVFDVDTSTVHETSVGTGEGIQLAFWPCQVFRDAVNDGILLTFRIALKSQL